MSSIFPMTNPDKTKIKFGIMCAFTNYPEGIADNLGSNATEVFLSLPEVNEEKAVKMAETLIRGLFERHRSRLKQIQTGKT